jgi:hypothetical protein
MRTKAYGREILDNLPQGVRVFDTLARAGGLAAPVYGFALTRAGKTPPHGVYFPWCRLMLEGMHGEETI